MFCAPQNGAALESNESHPGDREHEKGEMFADSSLSIGDVVAWFADDAPGESVVIPGDEDGGVNGSFAKTSAFLGMFQPPTLHCILPHVRR